jgi:F0F1-type ATP synthase gamma subunit
MITVRTDKGLCGVLNKSLFKAIPDGDMYFISVGRKARQSSSQPDDRCSPVFQSTNWPSNRTFDRSAIAFRLYI